MDTLVDHIENLYLTIKAAHYHGTREHRIYTELILSFIALMWLSYGASLIAIGVYLIKTSMFYYDTALYIALSVAVIISIPIAIFHSKIFI